PLPGAPATQLLTPGPVTHEVQMPQTPPANSTAAKSSWWPLHMPKVSKPHLPGTASAEKKKATPKANSWAQSAPAAPKSGPLQSMKNGAHNAAPGTKNAYHKTVAALPPGSKAAKPTPSPGPRVAERQTSPPFWKKMFGAKEPEMQQPQTVPQWMAQK